MNKEQLLSESEKAFQRFTECCNHINEQRFFHQPEGKWSIAQVVLHLTTSVKTTTAAYGLPKFLVSLIGGKPQRPSNTFNEVVDKYTDKLKKGGKASGRYIPRNLTASYGKEKLLTNWKLSTTNYLDILKKNWDNGELDQYMAPHPLLGKITLRELCYFTIYHTDHHLKIINSGQ